MDLRGPPQQGTTQDIQVWLNDLYEWLKNPYREIITFASADATPTVNGNHHFNTNTGALTITDFDDGYQGQVIYVVSKGAITFDTTSTNLTGSSVDIVTASGDTTTWLCDDGTTWKLLSWIDTSKDNSATT